MPQIFYSFSNCQQKIAFISITKVYSINNSFCFLILLTCLIFCILEQLPKNYFYLSEKQKRIKAIVLKICLSISIFFIVLFRILLFLSLINVFAWAQATEEVIFYMFLGLCLYCLNYKKRTGAKFFRKVSKPPKRLKRNKTKDVAKKRRK